MSLTYISDYSCELVCYLEEKGTVYGNEQGTAESELLLIKAKHLPEILRDDLRGFVGGLEITEPEDDELVMLLIDSTPLHQDAKPNEEVHNCAIYWLHFNFE